MAIDPNKLIFLNCVHPLLVDNEEFPEFPYSQIGSGFLVLFEGKVILVSAKHCFENYLIEDDEVCILDGGDNNSFLSFDRVSRVASTHPTDDKDFADIVLMRVKPGTVSAADILTRKIQVFPIDTHLVTDPKDRNIERFVLRGFPLDVNAVDHELKRIPRKSLTVAANYSSQDSSSHVHVLEVDNYTAETNGNGMSGGAAVALVKDDAAIHAKLAGIIIKGFHGSRIARIIDARVLLFALQQASKSGAL